MTVEPPISDRMNILNEKYDFIATSRYREEMEMHYCGEQYYNDLIPARS